MAKQPEDFRVLGEALRLPCGATIKNRIAKSPMSDSLGDGEGGPTKAQINLYEKWARGGAGLSVVGEVQCDPRFPEKPGNLALTAKTEDKLPQLRRLCARAAVNGALLWAQIGHAGALSYAPVSRPKGPSALRLPGLACAGMSKQEVCALPALFAAAAARAKAAGFGGVLIHAGHGFLLSQFLSPLFNRRQDSYGGSPKKRARILAEIINETRRAVGASFPVGARINAADMLEGGIAPADALQTVALLSQTTADLIDISGGTYFPGAKSTADAARAGPYFIDFARQAKKITDIPLMLTGGFKKRAQAAAAIREGAADLAGVARGMVLNPALANAWLSPQGGDPQFPKFPSVVPGGVTAWHTMRLTALGENREHNFALDLPAAVCEYEARDAKRAARWQKKFPLN